MFKLTKGGRGLRRSSGGGGQTPRVQGLKAIRANSTAPHPTRPAFMPDTPQEQAFDSSTSRVNERS